VTTGVSGSDLLHLLLAVVALVALAAAAGRWRGTGQSRDVLVVTGRAVVQLLAVGLVVRVVFSTPGLAPLYLLLMLGAASFTSARRLGALRHTWPATAAAITAGAATATGIVLLTGALGWDTRTVVPLAAQLIGGSMTATTLAALRLADDVSAQWAEVEGWIALGARPRRAVDRLARAAAGRALVPALDQTRNVGLVVLPGAFVGLLLGGATPLEAGRVQLLVLVGLLAAETVAAALVTTLLADRFGRLHPGPATR
jgi:putative ABC transport system permease protein